MGRVQDLFFTIKDLVGELRELPARSLGPNVHFVFVGSEFRTRGTKL